MPDAGDLGLEEKKLAALRISSAAMGVGHADGFSALGVASALLLGLLAHKRGAPGQAMQSSMLLSMAHVLVEDMVEYSGREPLVKSDSGLHGLSARYRLYETADGWVFLAAPAASEWDDLVSAMKPYVDLAGDARFADEESRRVHDDALVDVLGGVFRSQPARAWETELLAVDVGCLEVRPGPPDVQLFSEGGMGRANGWIAEVEHPTIGAHPRLAPLVEFSRSSTVVKPERALRHAHRRGARGARVRHHQHRGAARRGHHRVRTTP